MISDVGQNRNNMINNIKNLEKYFNVSPRIDGVVDINNYKIYLFQIGKLYYELILNLVDSTFSISFDYEMPFGAKSLFEICTEFNEISIDYENEYYGDIPILNVMRKDSSRAIMIIKWDDNKISIWPT